MSAIVLALMLLGQLQLGEIRGSVVDDSGAVLPGVRIELTDPLGGLIAAAPTDSSGRFVFAGVAPGRYAIRADLTGFQRLQRQLTITNAVPVDVTLRLQVSAVDVVIVDEGHEPDTPAARASIAGDSIAHVPIRNAAKGVQEIVATLPGWSAEDNGLLHARGTDDGFLYVIDGIPVYERLDQVSGIAPDASSVESINVLTGYLPAEYGYKAGGVIAIQSKFGGTDWLGAAAIARGSERSTHLTASVGGPLTRELTLTAAGAAQQSDRFLDPVHPDNFHNRGDVEHAGGALRWLAPDRAIVTIAAGAGRSAYDVPNTALQDDAGQDQRQQLSQWYGSASWQHVWSSRTYSQVSAYVRSLDGTLRGSAADTPLFANADRSLRRSGALAALVRNAGGGAIKIGVDVQRLSLSESFGFAVTDQDAAIDAGFSAPVLDFDRRHPFAFTGTATPTLVSAFIQGDWYAMGVMTVNGGVRLDRATLLQPRTQLSPRIGATYRLDRTVLRGSVSRFFQPPQPENILLASSNEARVLSPFFDLGGGAAIEPETQWGFEAGLSHDAQRVRIDAAAWFRAIKNAADPNVFAGTTIIFPNAVASGRARGVDVRVEVPSRRGWSGYVSATISHVRQRGPITGGLFLEDDIAEIDNGDEFIPDHDQPIAAGAGITWSPESSIASLSAVVQYQSGSPLADVNDDDTLHERRGAELVDFDAGRVKARTVASIQGELLLWKRERRSARLRVAVENLFDARYAYNFGNPFSGTHFGAPRTFSIGLRGTF